LALRGMGAAGVRRKSPGSRLRGND